VSTTLTRRLERLETSARDDLERRWAAAVETMRETLAPEHGRLIADWLRGPGAVVRAKDHGHSEQRVCNRCILDGDPPALVRAALLILVDHLTSGAPVVLPPNVAEIYLADPDAYPASPCDGCGYLLPTQSKLRPDGTYQHIGWYLGECPVCGLDNHPEIEESKDVQ
jgi:hypothetical protein